MFRNFPSSAWLSEQVPERGQVERHTESRIGKISMELRDRPMDLLIAKAIARNC